MISVNQVTLALEIIEIFLPESSDELYGLSTKFIEFFSMVLAILPIIATITTPLQQIFHLSGVESFIF
ncbi:MAG: hypothetical protein ACFE8U_06835 [Candidatus Hermodarchaeota archaeon]